MSAPQRTLLNQGVRRFLNVLKVPFCWIEERRYRWSNPGQAVSATVVVSGVPRGGTTWLAEVLACVPGTRIVFEPLTGTTLQRHADLPFTNRQNIPEHAEWPEAESYLRRVLSGHCFRRGMLLPRLFSFEHCPQILVKFCRLNRMLPWFVRRFDVRPPVLLVRHPCAVVASQLRARRWQRYPASYRVPDARYSEFFEPYRPILDRIREPEERLAAMWCLDHIVPLRHPQNDRDWITVSYEALVLDGPRQLDRIFARLGVEQPQGVEDQLHRPSATAPHDAMILTGGNLLTGWRQALDAGQVRRILDMVNRFGLGDLYGEALEPQYERLYASDPVPSAGGAAR